MRARLVATLPIVLAVLGCASQTPIAPTGDSVASTSAPRPTDVPRSLASPDRSVILRANAILGAAWSPGQQHLAVTTSRGGTEPGQTIVLDPTGSQAATLPGDMAAWIDDDHLLTARQPVSDVEKALSLTWITDLAAGTTTPFAAVPRAAELLGNGHGAVAIATLDDASWHILARGVLEAVPPGLHPVAWSGDGTLLASTGPPANAGGGTTGVTLASTGGIARARLTVLRYLGWDLVFDSGATSIDERIAVEFSPDGDRIVGGAVTGDAGAIVFDLRGGAATTAAEEPGGWTPDGSLVLVGPLGHISLLAPDGTRRDPDVPAGRPSFGPRGAIAVISRTDGQATGTAFVGREGAWQTLAGLQPDVASPMAWAPDGSAVFISTGTLDAQTISDWLLRVTLP